MLVQPVGIIIELTIAAQSQRFLSLTERHLLINFTWQHNTTLTYESKFYDRRSCYNDERHA